MAGIGTITRSLAADIRVGDSTIATIELGDIDIHVSAEHIANGEFNLRPDVDRLIHDIRDRINEVTL